MTSLLILADHTWLQWDQSDQVDSVAPFMGFLMHRMQVPLQAMFLLQAAGALASSDPETAPVLGVLTRVVGAETASIFELKVNSSMAQGFSLAPTAAETTENGVVVAVTASGLPELSYGAGYYLRTYAGMSFAWDRSGGNQVA
eukprot:COSAG02_NODE_7451_length_3008_cov_1.214850_3_plen_143_part_00